MTRMYARANVQRGKPQRWNSIFNKYKIMFKNMGYIPKDHIECYKVINLYKTDKHFML